MWLESDTFGGEHPPYGWLIDGFNIGRLGWERVLFFWLKNPRGRGSPCSSFFVYVLVYVLGVWGVVGVWGVGIMCSSNCFGGQPTNVG